MEYDREFLDEVNESINLLEYVSKAIPMKRRGKNEFFGRCPLHVDNTPSFNITEGKNSFYCFSCGRSGGIINYLIEYEHLSFKDAVEKAVKLSGLDIGKLYQSETVLQLKKLRTLKAPRPTITHEILSQSVLEKYDNRVADEWTAEGIPEDVQRIFGVRLDTYQNKIIYPVWDRSGNLINIKGRTRYKDFKKLHIPKYINYYKIGTMDYFQCLNITEPYIKEKGEAIIFESIKSVMKAYSWGYKNCISAEKHTLTDEQIILLTKLKCDVVFAFDSDISYDLKEVKQSLDKLKKITNVYIIVDSRKLLGGAETKNSPVDLTKEIWEELYANKRKIT